MAEFTWRLGLRRSPVLIGASLHVARVFNQLHANETGGHVTFQAAGAQGQTLTSCSLILRNKAAQFSLMTFEN